MGRDAMYNLTDASEERNAPSSGFKRNAMSHLSAIVCLLLGPEDGDKMHTRNVGKLLTD
jgi:hypothetical protein